MTTKKITHGYVVQTYRDNICVSQEFVSEDIVNYEDDYGNPCDPIDDERYQPFDMLQPDPDDDFTAA